VIYDVNREQERTKNRGVGSVKCLALVPAIAVGKEFPHLPVFVTNVATLCNSCVVIVV
jgi:hypothetical protein